MPKFTIKVRAADKLQVQDSGEWLLSVQFDILTNVEYALTEEDILKPEYEGKQQGDIVEVPEVVATMRHGFPLDIIPGELQGELQGVLAAYEKDSNTAEATAEFAERDAQADETIAAILEKEIIH